MTSVALIPPVPVRITGTFQDLFQSDCPGCGDSLVIHQPDPELPDRLLGTCGACKTWALITPDPDRDGFVLTLLSPAPVCPEAE